MSLGSRDMSFTRCLYMRGVCQQGSLCLWVRITVPCIREFPPPQHVCACYSLVGSYHGSSVFVFLGSRHRITTASRHRVPAHGFRLACHSLSTHLQIREASRLHSRLTASHTANMCARSHERHRRAESSPCIVIEANDNPSKDADLNHLLLHCIKPVAQIQRGHASGFTQLKMLQLHDFSPACRQYPGCHRIVDPPILHPLQLSLE